MAINDNHTSTDQLAALIAAKLQVVEVLARLGGRQLELIERGEMAGLVKLLAAKQTVLQQLQLLDRQLDPYRGDDPERRVWQSAAQRALCQAQADRCNALLAEAMDLARQGEAAMLLRRDAAAAAISAAQTAADARSAYATQPAMSLTTLRAYG
jgi:hypothetical protein